MVELVEVEPGRWRVKRPPLTPARSTLPLPYVISDIMDPVEQVDGRFYTSKAAFRRVGRANGLIEVGTEKLSAIKPRETSTKQVKDQRRRDIRTAIERYRAGHRPERPL